MLPTLATRKPIDRLTPDDLRAFPVWEFADDEEEIEGRDETWVRPLNARCVPRGYTSLSVAATFLTADGRELRGIVGVSTFDEPEIGHAAITLGDQYIFVPASDFQDAAETYREGAAKLGSTMADVFPLRFSLDVPLEGETERLRGVYST